MASLMPQGKQRYTDNNGNNLSGGKVYAYAAGTSTPLDTYSDQAGATPNTNPVVLNARGEATIFWGSSPYKVVLKDASDVEIWSQDNLYANASAQFVEDLASVASGKGDALVGVKSPGTNSASRTQHDKNDESVSVLDFSGASAHNKFINALTYLDDNGGGVLRVNRGQQFTIEDTILKTLANDIEIVFEAGAKLIAATGLAVPVLDLRASASAITERIGRIRNPRIDCSAGTTTAPGQGCTAISAQYFKQLIIENCALHGGDVRDNVNSDSGITPIDCDYVMIDGGRIRGFSDGGVYIGGDNTAGAVGDGITATIRGVLFERCNNAVLGKRDLAHLQVINNYVSECGSGIIAAEITTPNYTNPVRRLDIIGNRFHKTLANVARYRGPTKGQFSNNIVEDWGYEPDGVSNPAGANGYALVIQGSSGIDVKNNEFVMNAWTLNDQRAYLLDNVTLDSVLYTQGGHNFTGNSYRNLPRVHVETASGNASSFIDEYYDGITTGKFSGAHASSLFVFRETGNSRKQVRFNGSEYDLGRTAIRNVPAGAAIVANDAANTNTNAGATALTVFTLPGAVAGLEFEFCSIDTDGVRVTAAAGDFIRIAGSASSSGGTATSTQVGTYLHIKALDSTNWVAKSATGTWTLA